ncbi:MAG TPA: glycosyltransferase family 39 protein [Roseiflexaceae bacterium]|nr:glycosyltransferase family 39 protein [Roseiflexaceae bacterium]
MPRYRPLAAPAAFFLLALALRLYAIDRQSLWYDEGLTVALAQRPLAQIARDAAADVHPPLYYWALHAWVALFGASEAAARSLSALCGALTAALTCLIGRRWFGSAAGALSGLAAAVSPFAVHYGQEARMYALAGLLATLLWLALERWLAATEERGPGTGDRHPGAAWPWLLLYAAAALAALLTHYFMAAFVATAAAAGVATLHRRGWFQGGRSPPWSSLVPFTLAHLALAAAYLPLVWGSRARLEGWSLAKEPTGPLFILSDALRVFALGPTAAPEDWPWLALFGGLLLAALLRPALRPARVWFAAAWLLVPLAAIVLLSLGQPYYRPRFLLPALPAFHLLLGAGASAVGGLVDPQRARRTQRPDNGRQLPSRPILRALRARRGSPLLAATLLLLAAIQPLAREYTDPRFWRDDYRGVAQAIAATARADDAVLLVGPGQREVLDYYLRRPLARYPLPRVRPLDRKATLAELERIAGAHRRLYGVYYVPYEADPAGVIQGWLREHAFRAASRWYGGVELVVYELGAASGPERAPEASFGGQVRLARVAAGPAELRPGDALRVEATWVAEAPVTGELLLFAHLLGPGGKIVAQFDGSPAPEPPARWRAGAPQRGRFAVLVPSGAPPGAYRLVVGLYEPASGRRLTLPDGADALEIAGVHVGEAERE